MIKGKIFLDGNIIQEDESLIESFTPGVLTGRGVFETMRAYNGKIFLLGKHINRLKKGLKLLSIEAPYSKNKIKESIYLVLRMDKLKDARVRLTIWERNRRSHITIITIPYKKVSQMKYREGIKAVTSNIVHKESLSKDRIKSINYQIYLESITPRALQRPL